MRFSLHPVIRVVSLIVFAITVTRVSLWHMLPAVLALGLVYFRFLHAPARKRALTVLYRMRWFFVSLLFVYGWLSPDPVTGQVSLWAWPSQAGLYAGCRQLLALALIMLAVNLLLVCSRRQELVQAVYWLARPLSWFGLSRERLAVRLVLVLDRAVDVRERVSQEMAEHRTEIHQPRLRWRLATLAHMAATLIGRTLKRIEAAADQRLTFTPLSAPPWYQWGLPAVIIPLLLLPL